MIIQIRARDDNGKFGDALPGDFAREAIRRCLNMGDGDGWGWFRDWACRVLIQRAMDFSGNSTVADKWYARYQALRNIGELYT